MKQDTIQQLRHKLDEAKKLESIKTKKAADAARELSEAIAKLEVAGKSVTMTEAQTRATAWQKARKSAAEIMRPPLLPQHSKGDTIRPGLRDMYVKFFLKLIQKIISLLTCIIKCRRNRSFGFSLFQMIILKIHISRSCNEAAI